MKKVKCRIRIHGRCKEHDGGTYESIAEAKRNLVYEDRPYTIVKLTTN